MKKIFSPQDKVIANSDKVLEFLKTGNTAPVLVELDPSNTCSQGCVFCISSYIHLDESKNLSTFNRSIMSRDMLLNVCKDCIDLGVRALTATGGGEPLVNKHLPEAIEYVKNNSDIKLGMFTNGTLIEQRKAFEILVDCMTWVRISIDSGTRETYNRIRRPRTEDQNFDGMWKNLIKLLETREKRNSKTMIGVGYVITPDNYREIVDFANMFKDLDVDYCQYKPEIVNQERDEGIQREAIFWKEKVEPLISEAKIILGDKFQINGYKLTDLIEDPTLLGRHYKKCLGSQIQPCIGADGEIYICVNQRGYKDYSYGSLYDKSFKDIWNDMNSRNEVRWKIDERDLFCNCTSLCKPSESNKIFYDISQKWNSLSDTGKAEYETQLLQIEMPLARENTEHWEFI